METNCVIEHTRIMETNFIIETERLFLIRPSHYYLEKLHQLHANPKTNLYNPDGPHQSIEETEAMLESWMNHWLRYSFGYCLMIEKKTGEMLGICGLSYKQLNGETYLNLAYRLETQHTRKGYTKEACKAVIKNVKIATKVNNKILVRTKTNNLPSIKTAESFGFVRDSHYDDFESYDDIYFFES
ncbi:hypothetical protein CD110_02005 [Staphylococcus casei]|uniref:GNAT family N-acetyltransferase n=1 Tax=Staphylococcus TaxID=1279 RepID=UPI000CD2EC44|nr:GNAT family N-acetyltransferase [Staphylococcus casei]PNZ62104.1 hypothetical protein CD110_02005 [Staphylococcus casei]WJE86829.1 GNAT family N-acetyltransferase [Staphylococcus casei]